MNHKKAYFTKKAGYFSKIACFIILVSLLTSCSGNTLIIKKNNDIKTMEYNGSYFQAPNSYYIIGENITGIAGNYMASLTTSFNSSVDYNYYFSVLKNGEELTNCTRIIGGTGKPLIASTQCELNNLVTNDNISLGVKII